MVIMLNMGFNVIQNSEHDVGKPFRTIRERMQEQFIGNTSITENKYKVGIDKRK